MLRQPKFSEQALGRHLGDPSAARPAGLLAGLKLCLLGSLILAAAVLMERRLSGELASPLGAGWLAAVAILAVLAARLARGCDSFFCAHARNEPAAPITATACSSTLACVVLAGALSLPGSSVLGLAALWLIVVGSEGAWWFVRLRQPSVVAKTADEPWVMQQTQRDRHGDGHERVTGWLRVDVAEGQRVAQVHVAFCPPLEQAPAIELRQTEGPAARLKLGQALPYGARFELKLPEPGPASIVLEYVATSATSMPKRSSVAELPAVPLSTRAMARWPRHKWTSIYTYGVVFVVFPLLCLLAYAWVRGWPPFGH